MATQTTLTSADGWSPDVNTFAPTEAVPEALVLQTSSVLGNIEGDDVAVRVAFVDDDDAQFTAEGATIPEAEPVLDEVLVYTGKVTQLVHLSREQWLQPGASNRLADSVRRAVTKKANEVYLTQAAPTSPAVTPPAGLLNVDGIADGGAVADDLDNLVDLIATLEGNGANPTHLVVDPTGWASLRKLKTATRANTSLLGAGTSDAARVLLDLPVLVSGAMTAGTGAVLDRAAIASAVGLVRVAQSEHVYFTSDGIALRCTWRIGWNVAKPDRLGTFTVTDPDAG